ncbi:MarR family winged helix-turn-helix transcriptional regulator [Nocardia brevicatena]|uniref:MarR family winged helix-turn-helix transcriptional regulator n=1 Tax=Nocardia brevicatena TaxID=37327 RepID=UPI0002EE9AF4|nr:MarR family transcriptional regulator [Nocardia brevicatena]
MKKFLLVAALALALPLTACGSSAGNTARTPPAADTGENRLIGYQVKRLDQLFNATFGRLLGEAGLTRREWQTLHTISRKPTTTAELLDALRPFWEVDRENLDDVADTLIERGWVERTDGGRFALTASGRTAHADAADTVGRLRELAVVDVTDEDYALMMDTMQRIIDNLERAVV